MKIVVVYSDHGHVNTYGRLLNVFARSASIHIPAVDFEVLQPESSTFSFTPAHGLDFRQDFFVRKMRAWNAVAQRTQVPCIFADADMLVTGDLAEGMSGVEHVGITYRDPRLTYIPINTGIVFFRPTPTARHIFAEWTELTRWPARNANVMNYFARYGMAIDQAALGYMIENALVSPGEIQLLPCSVYNACQENLPAPDPAVKCIHIKSRLRDECLGRAKGQPRYPDIVELWRGYDRAEHLTLIKPES